MLKIRCILCLELNNNLQFRYCCKPASDQNTMLAVLNRLLTYVFGKWENGGVRGGGERRYCVLGQ